MGFCLQKTLKYFAMPVLKNIVCFSSDCAYLAYSSPDGCLKIWETSTNLLKQEYTPSSHLSATCSTISWCPNVHSKHASKKIKKNKDSHDFKAISDLQLIAMGTLTGDILLYSYVSADLQFCLTNGHSSVVNDLCWCTSTCSLYSCSSDRNIVVWDAFTGKVKTKWKADNIAVYSICLIDRNNLLSASNGIKLWNVETKTVIKTFIGHASEVFRLIPIRNEENSEHSYFLSAAIGDRVINAWQLNAENNKRAAASFVVSDEPENMSVITSLNEPVLLSVVCKDGSLHLFEHVLNGYKKKPINSKFCVQIASKKSGSHSKSEKISVLCATVSLGLSSTLLSYGNFLKPVFEKIDLSDVYNDLLLVRDNSLHVIGSQEDNVSRIKHTDKSEGVKLLAPGHLMTVKNAQNLLRKRKKKSTVDDELPMEERLRALDLSKIPPNLEEQESTLKADSMVHLLLQGLQSSDNNMINTVLQSANERIIRNTLKKLPLQSIILLLKELKVRLSKKESRTHPYIMWLKGLVSIHVPYLMSCKDVNGYLRSIDQLIQSRLDNFSKMCQLESSLRILRVQTSPNNFESNESDEPLAVYESESSGESDAEELDNNATPSDEEIADDDISEESSSSDSESNEEMESSFAPTSSQNNKPDHPLAAYESESSEESDVEELDNNATPIR